MFMRAVNLVTQLNKLVTELKNTNNPEYVKTRSDLEVAVDLIKRLELIGNKPPNELIEDRESLKKKLLEYDDPNEILIYLSDELKKSLEIIQGPHSQGHHTYKGRVTRGLLTPRNELQVVLMEVLKSNGGRAHIQDVQNQMAVNLKGKFTKEDLESLDDGVVPYLISCNFSSRIHRGYFPDIR